MVSDKHAKFCVTQKEPWQHGIQRTKAQEELHAGPTSEIIKDIERGPTIEDGLAKHHITSSLFYKWKRQLAVGINARLRNTKPLKPVDLKKLEGEKIGSSGGLV